MITRSVIFATFLYVIAAAAVPNPSPIDEGTAHVIALNNNLACSTGTCNTTILERTNATSTVPLANGGLGRQHDTWSPFTLLTMGGLALSTGML